MADYLELVQELYSGKETHFLEIFRGEFWHGALIHLERRGEGRNG